MTYLSTAQVTALADNVAKTLIDIETDLITNPAGSSPTVATITAGQNAGSNSLSSRILALTPGTAYSNLQAQLASAVSAIVNYISISKTTMYALYAPLMVAMDADVGNLADFLNANSLQVHPEFAACFNYVATNGLNKGWVGYLMAPIMPPAIFPSTETSLATFAPTGASTGTFTAGTAIDLSKYAPQELWLKNTTGAGTTGTATAFHITYKDASGNAAATKVYTLGGAMTSGQYIDLSIAGSVVSAITISAGGNAADTFAIVAKLLRTVAY